MNQDKSKVKNNMMILKWSGTLLKHVIKAAHGGKFAKPCCIKKSLRGKKSSNLIKNWPNDLNSLFFKDEK